MLVKKAITDSRSVYYFVIREENTGGGEVVVGEREIGRERGNGWPD